MSGMLRPVGPEPTGTYWIRRALVIGALAVSIALVVAAVRALGSPDPTPAVPPPSTTPTPVAPKTSTPPSPSPTPPASSAGTSATPSTPSSTPSTSQSAGTSPKASPSPTPTKPSAPPEPPACAASDLRLTLIGKRTVRARHDSSYELSVINGGKDSCVATIDRDTFELAITSGSDPIWSSDHCDAALERASKTLGSEEALAWTMTWNGERSRKGCKNSSDRPRPGIYWATAELDGAEPVKWRMALED